MLRDEAIKKAELLFQALDADGDGSLTQVNKMTPFIFCLDEKLTPLKISKLFNSLNLNSFSVLRL